MAMVLDHAPRPHGGKPVQPILAKVSDIVTNYRPVKLFRREEDEAAQKVSVVSLDFDDPGDLLMTAHDDDTIKLYSVKTGTHTRNVLSKKYGVKLAKFMHSSSCILYASTKSDHAIRYMTTHDSAFIRYFVGHEQPVTCLAIHPGADNFISCSMDNTVRIWDANSQYTCGKLNIIQPYLAAFDPSAHVIAIASHAALTILLYDYRNYDKAPFGTFDMMKCIEEETGNDTDVLAAEWTKLEFSNDGKHLLVGTTLGHFVLDAFTGKMKTYLVRAKGNTGRLAPGESPSDEGPKVESSGDVCWTQDGRYVVGGSGEDNVYVWDTQANASMAKRLDATHALEFKGTAAVLAFNPRYNFFATADKEVVMWAPEL